MLGEEFFPTPFGTISDMVSPISAIVKEWYGVMVLDPSAGKGDILDYFKDYRRVPVSNIEGIEISPELRAVCASKGYKMIDSDFLQYRGAGAHRVIVMNPPFSNGDEHLLKAWDILRDGYIACLLNAETIRNPHTEKRKLLARIIADHSLQEPKFIGSPFKTAERKTDVECVIVWLHKTAETSKLFDGVETEDAFTRVQSDFNENPLASRDFFQTLVQQYEAAESSLTKMHEAEKAFVFYTRGVFEKYDEPKTAAGTYLHERVTELRYKFWRYLFNKSQVNNIATSKVKEDLEKYIQANKNMAFNLHNIYEVVGRVMNMRGDIINQAIVAAFDAATAYHKDTVKHTEGWKTNLSWRVSKKIIIPNATSAVWSTTARAFFEDIDKALCHLTGKRVNDIVTVQSVVEANLGRYSGNKYGEKLDSEFFTIVGYQKGTVHLTFKDLTLLETFNVTAAKLKGMAVGDGSTQRKKPAAKAKPQAASKTAASVQPLLLGGGS